MNLKDIILLVLDEAENFNDENTQLRIGAELYKNVILIRNKEDFKKNIASFDENQKFALLCHVFHASKDNKLALRGYLELTNSNIEEEFNIEAVLVSAGDSGEVMQKLYVTEKVRRIVYLYSNFRDDLKNDKIPIYTRGGLSLGIKKLKQKNKLKKGIFLSHSSKDAEIVNKFRDLILSDGLGYDLDKVKFTSHEDYSISAGSNIPNDLKNFLINDMGLFIQFLSTNYSLSRTCLNEEGAAWCLVENHMFIPISISKFKSTDISWVQSLNKAISISNYDSLLNIYQDRKEFFGKKINVTRLSKKINEFLVFINSKAK